MLLKPYATNRHNVIKLQNTKDKEIFEMLKDGSPTKD